MGLSMYLYGVVNKYEKQEDDGDWLHERHMYEVGYWRKAWIIFYWFIKEFIGKDDIPIESLTINFEDEQLEFLVEDCKETIKYYDKYEEAHRNGARAETIPSKCLLGDEWDYLFYNRYTKEGYIGELEYTIELCEKLLKENKYESYAFEASI